MDNTWFALFFVWAIAEAIQAGRKRPFPQRMSTGAIWGVVIAVLAALGSASRDINSFAFIPIAILLYGRPALMVYGVRLWVANRLVKSRNK